MGTAADVVDACDADGTVEPLRGAGMLAVPLNRPLGVGDGDTAADAGPVVPVEGEKIAGMDDEDPAVQAETDAERRRVAVAHPAAVSLDLLTLMRPPSTRQAAA